MREDGTPRVGPMCLVTLVTNELSPPQPLARRLVTRSKLKCDQLEIIVDSCNSICHVTAICTESVEYR